ncbi:trypsin CFT-1-like [Achroia grisella]|uniref:trypsin CFT-1-like n=1 Tax=Achroia grisella TaxID=688607 RepID=UPI0027D2E7E9|nr:trypsin CFT-1-like [Achroia grisella]
MRVLFLVALTVAAVSAVPRNPQRIVGGEVTSIDQWPEMVALLFSWTGSTWSQSCGGSIINNRSVLSAAHCFVGDSPNNWRVRAGSTNAHSGGIVHDLGQIIIHSGYSSSTLDNDVAILRVSSNFVYSNVISAGSIAGTNYNLADNQVVYATGWGRTSPGGPLSEQLRQVQIWSINLATCRSRYAELGLTVTDNMLCSGWLDVGGRDQCQGDSGGPLFHNGVIVGVCSWGYSCATARYPGVNARVSSYTTWIQANA